MKCPVSDLDKEINKTRMKYRSYIVEYDVEDVSNRCMLIWISWLGMDLARFSSFLFVGLGLIVKNHDGAVVFKTYRLEEIAVEPALAEALGVRWGLQCAICSRKRYLKLDNCIWCWELSKLHLRKEFHCWNWHCYTRL